MGGNERKPWKGKMKKRWVRGGGERGSRVLGETNRGRTGGGKGGIGGESEKGRGGVVGRGRRD